MTVIIIIMIIMIIKGIDIGYTFFFFTNLFFVIQYIICGYSIV